MPSHLSALLASGTAVDLDCNDEAAALLHNGDHVSKRLDDMTSNQLIIKAEIARADSDGDEYSTKIQELVKRAAQLAKELAEGRAFASVSGLERIEELKKRAAARVEEMENDDAAWKQGMAVDVAAAMLGLLVRPHLDSAGRLHSQVSPTLTRTADVVTHARRLVSLYMLVSSSTDGVSPVSPNDVCIKIPSTVAGLRACAELEAEGIVTLATACFTVEQGLASSEAKAHYVAPYVNSLQAHFYSAEATSEADKIQPDIFPSLCVNYAIQRLFRARKSTTEVMAASFIDFKEPLKLAGLDRVTIGAPILAVLRQRELDEECKRIIDEAVAAVAEGSDKVSELQAGLERRALEAESRSQGGWLDQGSEANKALVEALLEERPKRMLDDALSRFTAAEVWLRERMAQEL